MSNEEKVLLSEEELKEVSGGTLKVTDEFTARRDEFEKAWKTLKLDSRELSGMKKAQIFEDWELAGYEGSALAFLQTQSL